MKISFSTLGCPEWSFSDIISTACDLGYNGVEIRGVQNELDAPRIPQFTKEKAQATKDLLAKKQLTIACLTSACYMHDKNLAQATLKSAKEYIDTASLMGIKYVRLLADYGPIQGGDIDLAFVAKQIKEAAVYAGDKKVDVLIETNGFFANSKKMLELIESVGEQNVGVLWDIHHPYRYFDESADYTVGILGDLIRHVHIKDSVIKDGQLKYTMVGNGDIPVEKCIAELNKTGFDGYYSLEWLKRWDLSLEEPGIAFAAYCNYISNV